MSKFFEDTMRGLLEAAEILSYKNYNGIIEHLDEDGHLYGKVVGLRTLLSYEGNSVMELDENFRKVIDEYLLDCEGRNVAPEQSYKENDDI